MHLVSPLRWVAVGVVFAALIVGVYALGIYAYLNPAVVHKSQMKKAIAAAVGSSDVVKIAEKQIVSDAAQNGVTVTGFKVMSVTRKQDAVVVRLRVQTIEVGALTLDVTLAKSVYSVQAITRAG